MVDRAELLAEHTELRRERGVAAIDDQPFNGLRLVEIEEALDVAEDREAEQRRRELAAAAEARRVFVARHQSDIVTAEANRREAFVRAEVAAKALAWEIGLYLAASASIAASAHQLELDVPLSISGRTPAIGLSHLLADVLRAASPEANRLGEMDLPRGPHNYATWAEADEGAQRAVAAILAAPSPITSGEFQ
jgi:hypothetical protein